MYYWSQKKSSLTIESSIFLTLLLGDINFTWLLSLEPWRTFSLGHILGYVAKYQYMPNAFFTLYMLPFSRYTTPSFIKFISGRTYCLPWLIIVLRYITLYLVGGGWINTISFTFLSTRKSIEFDIFQHEVILPHRFYKLYIRVCKWKRYPLFIKSRNKQFYLFFCAWYIFRVFSAKKKTVKVTWCICVDFLLLLLEFPEEGKFFCTGRKTCWTP